MQTKKVTFEKLNEFLVAANSYIRSTEGKKNKLTYAIERVMPSAAKAAKKINAEVEDLRIEHASTDADGNLILKEGAKGEDRYSFKPDKLKQFKQAVDKLDAKLVDIDIYISSFVPDTLTMQQTEYLRGIVLPEDVEYKSGLEEDGSKKEPKVELEKQEA